MAKRIFLAPETGVRTTFTPDALGGQEVPATAKMFVDILETAEPPIKGAQSLAQLKVRYGAPTPTGLTIPFGAGAFLMGPAVLTGLTDSSLIVLGLVYEY